MKKFLATLLMGAAFSAMPVQAKATETLTPATPATTVQAENEATVWVDGPFYTYSAAAAHANYLEYVYGYVTEVVFQYGRFYVLYV